MVGYAPVADSLSSLREHSQRPHKPSTAKLGFTGWKNSHWPIMHHLAAVGLVLDGRSSQSVRGCTVLHAALYRLAQDMSGIRGSPFGLAQT